MDSAPPPSSNASFHVFLFVVAVMMIGFLFFCFLSTCMGTSLREYIMQSPTSRGYRNAGQSRLSRERDEIEMGMR